MNEGWRLRDIISLESVLLEYITVVNLALFSKSANTMTSQIYSVGAWAAGEESSFFLFFSI